MVFCNQCGHPMEEGKKFCNQCGSPMPERSQFPVQQEVYEPVDEQTQILVSEVPAQAEALPNSAEIPTFDSVPSQYPVQDAPVSDKPKRNLFPIIFFPVLGFCLVILLIICAPRMGRLVWGITNRDSSDPSYEEPYMDEITPPATQAPATMSTLSSEEAMYEDAQQLMWEGRYSEARELFASLGNYDDSVSLRQQCDFEIAHNYLRQNDLDSAARLMFAAGKELYEAGEKWISLDSGCELSIEDNDDYAIKTPGLYFSIRLSGIVCIDFDSQGNIIEWGKYYPEANGYCIGQDAIFIYDF